MQDYLTATVIFIWFVTIQELAQVWIFYSELKVFLKFFYLILFSIFCLVVQTPKMEQYLEELNFSIALQ